MVGHHAEWIEKVDAMANRRGGGRHAVHMAGSGSTGLDARRHGMGIVHVGYSAGLCDGGGGSDPLPGMSLTCYAH